MVNWFSRRMPFNGERIIFLTNRLWQLYAVLGLVSKLCPTLCNPVDSSRPVSSVHEDSPGEDTGVGGHALLQEIFPTQRSNPGLPHCRQILFTIWATRVATVYQYANKWSQTPCLTTQVTNDHSLNYFLPCVTGCLTVLEFKVQYQCPWAKGQLSTGLVPRGGQSLCLFSDPSSHLYPWALGCLPHLHSQQHSIFRPSSISPNTFVGTTPFPLL